MKHDYLKGEYPDKEYIVRTTCDSSSRILTSNQLKVGDSVWMRISTENAFIEGYYEIAEILDKQILN